MDFPKQKKIRIDNRDDKQKAKGDRLLFPEERGLSLGPDLVIESRNSTEKVACPFFYLFNMLIIKT